MQDWREEHWSIVWLKFSHEQLCKCISKWFILKTIKEDLGLIFFPSRSNFSLHVDFTNSPEIRWQGSFFMLCMTSWLGDHLESCLIGQVELEVCIVRTFISINYLFTSLDDRGRKRGNSFSMLPSLSCSLHISHSVNTPPYMVGFILVPSNRIIHSSFYR